MKEIVKVRQKKKKRAPVLSELMNLRVLSGEDSRACM